MTELLLVIVIVQLGFVLSRLPKKNDSSKESVSDRFEREQKGNAVFVASQLRKLHGCACAFTLWAPGRIFADESPSTQGRGIILDSDDEWVLIECPCPVRLRRAPSAAPVPHSRPSSPSQRSSVKVTQCSSASRAVKEHCVRSLAQPVCRLRRTGEVDIVQHDQLAVECVQYHVGNRTEFEDEASPCLARARIGFRERAHIDERGDKTCFQALVGIFDP